MPLPEVVERIAQLEEPKPYDIWRLLRPESERKELSILRARRHMLQNLGRRVGPDSTLAEPA